MRTIPMMRTRIPRLSPREKYKKSLNGFFIMVYLKKPNSLMKISPIPIGAIYFRMKISNLYICIFKVPLLLTSSHTIFLSRYHPVKREMHNPPSGNMILAVTKSKRSNMPSPKTVNPFMTPSDNEQNIPRKTQPPVTNLAAFPRERLNSSCK